MTADNIHQIVLDAFRVEHREQLEQIRALLGSLEPSDDLGHDARLAEAFRLAHSFKGGARVCDLRDAERLGHGLEAVLERLSRGRLPMSSDVAAAITLLLDTIEDWMVALDVEQPLPDTSAALSAVERVLAGDSVVPPNLQSKQDDPLLAVFRSEYAQHAARLRELSAEWSTADGSLDEGQLQEAVRTAHTLSGAAAVVEMPTIANLARSLEKLFLQLQAHEHCFDEQARQQIETLLKTADDAVAHRTACLSSDGGPEARSEEREEGNDAEPRSSLLAPRSSSTHQETVRISVESLERLTRSSAQMLAEVERLTHFTRQLEAFQHEVGDLEREREAVRRAAFSNQVKLAATAEREQLANHLEHMDRQIGMLARRARQLSVEQRRTTWLLRTRSANIVRGIHETRLVPAHSVFHGFRKMVRDLARAEGKEIEFVAEGLDAPADRMVLQELKDPLMHALRNCVTHGVEMPELRLAKGKPARGRVRLRLEIVEGRLTIEVEDDGRGIDGSQIKQRAVERGLILAAAADQMSGEELLTLVFEPGFSTLDSATELAGRGMGLSIVQSSVARLQGQVKLAHGSAGGTRLCLSVPVTVSTHRVLLVDCGGQSLAIPARHIERLLRLPVEKLETLEGSPVITHQRCPVRLKSLAGLLGIAPGDDRSQRVSAIYAVLLKDGARRMAIAVDALLEERDALIQPLDGSSAMSAFAGCILLEDGRIALVVQPGELWEREQAGLPVDPAVQNDPPTSGPPTAASKILIVDDSFTTRTLEKSILEAHGYRVAVAVDGVEALTQLRQQRFAAVISDIEMPRMDGFSLLERIKADRRLAGVPVILVTSRDRQEDQRRGLDLGAEAYIIKRKFDHQELLATVRQVAGTRVERQWP